ncbi:hypothetical protein [Sorangium sp. So ce131]|uniref:hypothetical protein n=1 Tax=Sorangium sp. So ce131 TaxID=3133282 RepID=UPI003F620288
MLPGHQLWVDPDCGLKTRGWEARSCSSTSASRATGTWRAPRVTSATGGLPTAR